MPLSRESLARSNESARRSATATQRAEGNALAEHEEDMAADAEAQAQSTRKQTYGRV